MLNLFWHLGGKLYDMEKFPKGLSSLISHFISRLSIRCFPVSNNLHCGREVGRRAGGGFLEGVCMWGVKGADCKEQVTLFTPSSVYNDPGSLQDCLGSIYEGLWNSSALLLRKPVHGRLNKDATRIIAIGKQVCLHEDDAGPNSKQSFTQI